MTLPAQQRGVPPMLHKPNLNPHERALVRVYAKRPNWVCVYDEPPTDAHPLVWRYLRRRGVDARERRVTSVKGEQRLRVYACWPHGDVEIRS